MNRISRFIVNFIGAFCLSLAGSLYALPQGSEFTLQDFLAVPLVCLLVAVGNGIWAALGRGDGKEIINRVKKVTP